MGRTKTGKSVRTVDLDPITVEVLTQHRNRQLSIEGSAPALVFPGLAGKVLRPATILKQIKKLGAEAGMPDKTFHSPRHFHATVSLQEQQNPVVVSRRLGHANVSITMETYGHVMPGWQESLAKAFANAMDGGWSGSLPPFSCPVFVLGDRVQGIVCGTPSRNMRNPPLGTTFSIAFNPPFGRGINKHCRGRNAGKTVFGPKHSRSRSIVRGRLGRAASLSQLVPLTYRPLCGLSNPHECRPTDGERRSDFPTSLKICSTAPSYVIAAPFLAAW